MPQHKLFHAKWLTILMCCEGRVAQGFISDESQQRRMTSMNALPDCRYPGVCGTVGALQVNMHACIVPHSVAACPSNHPNCFLASSMTRWVMLLQAAGEGELFGATHSGMHLPSCIRV